jgi:hypothetical protein
MWPETFPEVGRGHCPSSLLLLLSPLVIFAPALTPASAQALMPPPAPPFRVPRGGHGEGGGRGMEGQGFGGRGQIHAISQESAAAASVVGYGRAGGHSLPSPSAMQGMRGGGSRMHDGLPNAMVPVISCC